MSRETAMGRQDPLQSVRAALAHHPSLGRDSNVRIELAEGVIALDGTLADIAARRLIPRIAALAGGGLGIRDRLRLAPAAMRDDAAVTADLEQALASDPLLAGCRSRARAAAGEPPLTVQVSKGVARLEGRVGSLAHRRLAEVLAWWTPGCADVDNRLQVEPPEQDSDEAVTEALRMVLRRDRRVAESRIAVRAIDRRVVLMGILPDPEQKAAAEQDAWFVPGVHEVDNRIRVLDHGQLDQYADEASRESFPASDPPAMTPIIGVGGAARKDHPAT